MTRKPIVTTTLGTASFLLFAGAVHAAEIRVLSTQATEQAYRELVAQFEKASGHKVTTVFTGTLDANKRLAAGETYDLLIMSAPSIEEHIKAGKVVAGSRVDLAKSGVGVGVKAGAPKPDISTTEALKRSSSSPFFQRHHCRGKGSRRRQSARQLHHGAGSGRCLQEDWDGAGLTAGPLACRTAQARYVNGSALSLQ
jgi:hypothetical protein